MKTDSLELFKNAFKPVSPKAVSRPIWSGLGQRLNPVLKWEEENGATGLAAQIVSLIYISGRVTISVCIGGERERTQMN